MGPDALPGGLTMFRRRSPLAERLIGAIYGFLFVWVLLIVLSLMAGCANGVRMDDDERKACRSVETGCTVWTEAELRTLAQQWFKKGYHYGWKAANEEAGRDL